MESLVIKNFAAPASLSPLLNGRDRVIYARLCHPLKRVDARASRAFILRWLAAGLEHPDG